MGSRDYQREEVSASGGDSDIPARSHFLRQAARQDPAFLIASLLAGLAVRVAYRFLFDPAAERDPANFFAAGYRARESPWPSSPSRWGLRPGARSRLGSALRRLPLAGELVVRAVVMASAVVIVVGLHPAVSTLLATLSSRLAHPALADRPPCPESS